MSRQVEILNLLLDRYERSGHYLPGRKSNRRIMLDLLHGSYMEYRENNPDILEINRDVAALEAEGLVTAHWRKGYEDWLYRSIVLNLEEIDRVYAKAGREPLAKTADILYNIIHSAKTKIQTSWKLQFLEDEATRLQNNMRTSRRLPEAPGQVESILKVLQYTEKGPELMRVISANCFRDSKYLEQNLISHLVSIAKAYEPELIAYQASDDEQLTQNVVLDQLGILTYPEIFEFCGRVILNFREADVSTEVFQYGFCLQSENLSGLVRVDISKIKTIYFVENRTNYRHLILRGVPGDTLVVFHGGFYSPMRQKLFRLISESVDPSISVYFWGDIDLGGFLMYARLKKNIFPGLIPWRMGLEDYEEFKSLGLKRSETYIDSLREKKDNQQLDPCFLQVTDAIIQSGSTVEQEVML